MLFSTFIIRIFAISIFHHLALAKQFDQLRGLHLKGCSLIESPYVVRDSSARVGVSGLGISYLKRLQDDLGFTFDLVPWLGSWNDFIDVMANCSTPSQTPEPGKPICPCDIGVGAFIVSNKRVEKVNFLEAFDHTSLQVVSLKEDLVEDQTNSFWFLYYPFTWQTWVFLTGWLLIYSVGALLFPPFSDHLFLTAKYSDVGDAEASSCDGTTDKPSAGTFGSMGNIIWRASKRVTFACTSVVYGALNMLGSPMTRIEERDIRNHSLTVTYVLLGVVSGTFTCTLYQASLSVITFNAKKTSEFKSMDDIRECRMDVAEFGHFRGGYTQQYIENSVISPNVQKCSLNQRWTGPPMPYDSIDDGFMFLRQKRVKYIIGLHGTMVIGAQRDCERFVPVGAPSSSSKLAFVVSKGLDRTVFAALNSGTRLLLEEEQVKHGSVEALRNSCEEPKDYGMTLRRLGAAFGMFFVLSLPLVAYRIWHVDRDVGRARAQES